jgi:hypothetical protein
MNSRGEFGEESWRIIAESLVENLSGTGSRLEYRNLMAVPGDISDEAFSPLIPSDLRSAG